MADITQPLQLPCGAKLLNRLAKASMSEQLAVSDGVPSEDMVRLYERWGRGGAGLLITGHVLIDRSHMAESGNVVIDGDGGLEALQRVAAAATARGAHAWVQLNHPGRQTPRFVDPAPVSASAVPLAVGGGAFAMPRALSDTEVRDIVSRFANAALIAERAGFTGVQIHGAHGYLVSQFLSPIVNRRDDEWGGDAQRRMRFLLEIVRSVRSVVSSGFAVGVKLNSADFQRGGFSEDDAFNVIDALGDEGVDLLEVSGGTYERAAMFAEKSAESTRLREAFFIEFAERAQRVARMPLMVTGGFRTRSAMDAAIASGAVDVVGLARPLAVEPDLCARLLDGRAQGALSVRLSTGWKLLDSAMIGVWHQQQLRRMGSGADPDPRLSRIRALMVYLRGVMQTRTARQRPG
jgi:2,4-dienoyl-CoA reductase-like NADH-dependent reductase (Old Yellow Enzyme family)